MIANTRGPDTEAIRAVVTGRHGDPFSVLGPHARPDGSVGISVFAPDADTVEVIDAASGSTVVALEKIHAEGFYFARVDRHLPSGYRLRKRRGPHAWETADPYAFGSTLGDLDVYLLGEGTHLHVYNRLGAHATSIDGVEGVSFAVWAPNASRVSVIGQFNAWDGRRHPMRKHPAAGVWDLFIPGLTPSDIYKYELLDANGHLLPQKADPVGQAQEVPPATASRVPDPSALAWGDQAWMDRRGAAQAVSAPVSIYEVHLGSWRRGDHDTFLNYDRLGDDLIPYVKDLGFTHVEFLPVSEFPFGGSWGYQPIGLFAPTSRFGSPEAFGRLVDRMHQAGIGVILDWVPGHFPSDAHGLARFDGTALYEHEDPRRGFHKDWNTLIYNYGRREVANFLESNAHFWLDKFHIDGLRVDAVASMLYLDYSRNPGEWVPNRFGGRENLEAIDFLRRMNTTVYRDHPGVVTIAEEFDGLAASLASGRRRRPRVRIQVEHGMDARHAQIHRAGSRSSPLPPRQADVRTAVRVGRKLRPADQSRRGRAWQGIAHRQDARRSVAEVRQSARLPWVHVDAPRQEAAVHGL